eukprot:CCRYP_002315-RA/>CCRYP_002315-RA protein AED:0.53 eAED:0.46 QI:0/0/0/0.5/1/1/2/0/281
MLHVHRIAINLAATDIEDVYYAELDDPKDSTALRDRYCHIDQADLDKNLNHFNQDIDPSAPLIVYIRKQEDCQEFANDGHVDISEAPMGTTGTKHAIQCGAFTDAWKEWNRVPRANQTWLAWKTHWMHAFEEQKTIQCLTGGEFSANSTTQTTDDELEAQMVTSLNNLAMAAVQKNETVEKLIKMNAQKDKTIATLTFSLASEKSLKRKITRHHRQSRTESGTHNCHLWRKWKFIQMGPQWLLLVSRLPGHKKPHQRNMQNSQRRASSGSNQSKHHGRMGG